MSEPSVIKATFADFRIIKGRKQAQLVFELPIEQADEALQIMGGLPRSDCERWFAIARLCAAKPVQQSERHVEHRKFADLPLPQQVALRCGDVAFQTFFGVHNEEEAAQFVREHCKVNSRSEIVPDSEAAAAWKSLDNEFYVWQRGGIR